MRFQQSFAVEGIPIFGRKVNDIVKPAEQTNTTLSVWQSKSYIFRHSISYFSMND